MIDQPRPAYKGDEPFVFVCYSHEDIGLLYPEIGWLQDRGVHLWYDEGISAGRVWRGEIAQAIDACASVLFYVSGASLGSPHCNREINLALEQDKTILPVYLEDVALTDDLRLGLSRVHALHRDQDPNYETHLLDALGQATQAPPPRVAKPQPRWRAYAAAALLLAVVAGAWLVFGPTITLGFQALIEAMNARIDEAEKAGPIVPIPD